jgi:Methylamine utilisation protein MauE
MPALLIRIALGGVLLASAGLKVRAPRSSAAGLATFGFTDGPTRWVAWGSLIAVEAGLAVAVIAGSDAAAYLAAAVVAVFAALLVGAILRGQAGAPCGCFGAKSKVGWGGVARNAVLAAAFALVPLVPDDGMTTDGWLALGLGVCLALCAALAVAVLGLAREVGMLRLRLGPESALEIPDEGPPVGSTVALGAHFGIGSRTELLLAAFLSEACHVCRTVEPMLEGLAKEPILSVATFDEVADSRVWQDLGVPGSPYAIALDLDGTVLAKGSFNTLGQLESVLATAERRRAAPTAPEVGIHV